MRPPFALPRAARCHDPGKRQALPAVQLQALHPRWLPNQVPAALAHGVPACPPA